MSKDRKLIRFVNFLLVSIFRENKKNVVSNGLYNVIFVFIGILF